MDLSLLAALTIGFLGSVHCVGMCGGIVGALSSGTARAHQQSWLSKVTYHISYNAGRILSYTVAGAIAGFLGAQSAKIHLGMIVPVGALIAGLVMIALGFYLAGWSLAITRLEKVGQVVWKYIQPLGQRFLPVHTPLHALGLGLIWGWLPCGLVYSALALAMLSASPPQGALLMLGFGLGTLPALIILGGAYDHFLPVIRSPAVRRVAGTVIIAAGFYTVLTGLTAHAH